MQSLGEEIVLLAERVKLLTGNPHWQTHGELAESIVRQVLRRHLPSTIEVCRGFVVVPGTKKASSQIDVLLTDADAPSLFRDGELRFVQPKAVRGIIEVKTKTSPGDCRDALEKLSTNAALIRTHSHPLFVGYIGLGANAREPSLKSYLLPVVERGSSHYSEVNSAVVGDGLFIRYRESPPGVRAGQHCWDAYRWKGMALGLFVYSVLHALNESPLRDDDPRWFPWPQDLEEHRISRAPRRKP